MPNSSIPEVEWPQDEENRRIILERRVEPYGDALQELAMIGIDMDEAALSQAFDACLPSDAELAAGPEAWGVMKIRSRNGQLTMKKSSHSCSNSTQHVMDPQRRQFLGAFTLTPLALAVLGACSNKGNWPEGMQAIKWDRDTCVRCNMVISDRRFAAEMRGGERDTVFKFDDIGCLVFWMRDKEKRYPWMSDPATRMWVADFDGKGEHWLDPRNARFIAGRVSPMGYNFAAINREETTSQDFTAVRQQILARGK